MWRALVPYAAYSFVSLIGWTTRIRFEGLEHREAAGRGGKGFIFTFWHQRQVFFTYTHRGEPAHVLVSRSKDGEMIAETMRLSNIGAVRGSSSRRAAGAAKELAEILGRGEAIGITPDGPKGPARAVKQGVLFLAQKTGAAILPITNAVSNSIELRKAWDKFHVPLPFSKAAVVYGEPIHIGENDDLEEKSRILKERLDAITDRADRLVGRT
jgi:lysophospholipid acyltransferase (LPLAT)-like uncharacterized protein